MLLRHFLSPCCALWVRCSHCCWNPLSYSCDSPEGQRVTTHPPLVPSPLFNTCQHDKTAGTERHAAYRQCKRSCILMFEDAFSSLCTSLNWTDLFFFVIFHKSKHTHRPHVMSHFGSVFRFPSCLCGPAEALSVVLKWTGSCLKHRRGPKVITLCCK